jgi:hypothetical protein
MALAVPQAQAKGSGFSRCGRWVHAAQMIADRVIAFKELNDELVRVEK